VQGVWARMAQPRYINILFHPSGPRSIVKFCVRFLLRFVSLFVAPIGVHTDVHHAPPPRAVSFRVVVVVSTNLPFTVSQGLVRKVGSSL
jgi:hypothetical protein